MEKHSLFKLSTLNNNVKVFFKVTAVLSKKNIGNALQSSKNRNDDGQ